MTTVLERLGLGRPELRAWALYDWANSAFVTTVITAVFPIFFHNVICKDEAQGVANQYFSFGSAIALFIAALISPFLGALADFKGIKKKMLGIFLAQGVLATAAMFWLREGQVIWALVLFGIANLGLTGTFVFYDSFLPHLASVKERDRVSTAGYALGYLGGGIHLLLVILLFKKPQPMLLSVAIWWLVFSLPFFWKVPEPARRLESDEKESDSPFRVSCTRLKETFREIRQYRNAFYFLIAFLIYNDGIGTVIRMAGIYGTEIGLKTDHLIAAILCVQFVGIPFAFLFAWLAKKIGVKQSIYLALAVYSVICVLAYFMKTETEFWILALLVSFVQGGAQALSRSVFASLIPKHKSSEFFAFFSIMDKFAGILGPLLFGLTIAITGESRLAILLTIIFFVVGALLLKRVDVLATFDDNRTT